MTDCLQEIEKLRIYYYHLQGALIYRRMEEYGSPLG